MVTLSIGTQMSRTVSHSVHGPPARRGSFDDDGARYSSSAAPRRWVRRARPAFAQDRGSASAVCLRRSCAHVAPTALSPRGIPGSTCVRAEPNADRSCRASAGRWTSTVRPWTGTRFGRCTGTRSADRPTRTDRRSASVGTSARSHGSGSGGNESTVPERDSLPRLLPLPLVPIRPRHSVQPGLDGETTRCRCAARSSNLPFSLCRKDFPCSERARRRIRTDNHPL